MIKIYQQVFEGENSQNSDSFQAAIASILEIPIAKVPRIVAWNGEWVQNLDGFVRPYGFEVVSIASAFKYRPRGYYLIVGSLPDKDFKHVVVAKGNEIVHDTYPDDNGSKLIPEHYVFFIADMEKVTNKRVKKAKVRMAIKPNQEYFVFDRRGGLSVLASGVATTIQPFIEDGQNYWQVNLRQTIRCFPEEQLITPEQMTEAYRDALNQGIVKVNSDHISVFTEAYMFSKSELSHDEWFKVVTADIERKYKESQNNPSEESK